MHWFPPTVHITAGAFDAIVAEARGSENGNETGGLLFGHDTTGPCGQLQMEVRHMTGPGLAAERTPVFFRPDIVHGQNAGLDVYKADRSVWIGTWHTHLGWRAARPSSVDVATYRKHLADEGLGFDRFLSIIVTPTLSRPRWRKQHLWAWLIELRTVTEAVINISEGPCPST